MLSKLRTVNEPADAHPRKASAKRVSGGLAVAIGALCTAWAGMAAAQVQTPERQASPVVQTKEGPVQGFAASGVTKFLGIPYAEPPVGDLRWQPPKDRAPWTNVRKATEFAPI
jgi:para-nitrobenzyl esterase